MRRFWIVMPCGDEGFAPHPNLGRNVLTCVDDRGLSRSRSAIPVFTVKKEAVTHMEAEVRKNPTVPFCLLEQILVTEVVEVPPVVTKAYNSSGELTPIAEA